MTFKALPLLSALLASTTISALTLDESKVLSVPIAQEGLTRISVKGDKIVHLFSSPAEAGERVVHHDSGHVFVSLSGFEDPISLSLVTGEGQTQDLTLMPKKGLKASPLVIEKPVTKKSPKSQTATLQSQAGEVLNVFVAGGIAPGFREVETFKKECRPLLEMKFEEKRRFETPQLRVSLFEGQNLTDRPQAVQALALTRGRDLALYVIDGEISPEDQGRVFIVQRNEDES